MTDNTLAKRQTTDNTLAKRQMTIDKTRQDKTRQDKEN
jgi:hypothetical protein